MPKLICRSDDPERNPHSLDHDTHSISSTRLELGEGLDSLAGSGKHTEDVESDGLAEGPALADDDLVTGLDTEGGRDVGREVLVALLVTRVLRNVMEVFAADNQSAVHLSRDHCSGEDTATDRDHAGEGALLVNVRSLNGGLGGPEPQSNILIPSPAARALARSTDLVVKEDMGLLLVSALRLDCEFGRHDCGLRMLVVGR